MIDQPFEWGMCSEWKKWEKPKFPSNPKAKFIRIYVSKMGMVMCFAEESEKENLLRYEDFVEANKDNPYLEWTAAFPSSVCKL